jgi:hypothetical protein
MESKRIDLKEMRERNIKRKESVEKKRKLLIESLSEEKFCEILDILPFMFEFKLSNISEDADGSWVKEYFQKNEPETRRPWESHYVWHNLTNDRYCSSASLFSYKDRVVDAIYKKGAFSDYYNIKRKWQTLFKVVLGENISKKLTKEKLEELYYEQKKSLEDVAKEYGTSRQNVMKIMKRYGLVRRPRSRARYLAMEAGKFPKLMQYEINEKVFSIWSPQMAWALGLLLTDGHIHGNNVKLALVDIDLLEKVKNILNLSKPIITSKQSYDKSKLIHYLAFSSKRMREDLNKLGLIEKKSLILVFPDVPEKYIRHFIRGCWDGDGSVFFDQNKLVASYISGSKKFIERLVQELYKIGISKGVSYRYEKSGKRVLMPVISKEILSNHPDGRFPLTVFKDKRANAYYIKIRGKENIEKLFHYFYDDVDESIYLTRKYEIFVKGLKLDGKGEKEQLTLNLDF